MKLLILCVVSLIGVVLAGTDLHPRGCIYVMGRCVQDCEEGTHAYRVRGDCGPLTREATCENPNPVADTSSIMCDFTACYCDPPTVRDSKSKKCIPLEECPK